MMKLLILYVISASIGILWFIDEILSFRNIKHYSIKYNKPPLIAWALHHHLKGIIYIKLVLYVTIVYFAAEILKEYFMYFHTFTLLVIVLYLLFDIKIQRKL